MALPVILFNTSTGSDTQASGAGPATALFGTTDASTDGTGTTVTVTAGTDLTNVATDGSHVIYLADATAGARNFGKITGKAGSGGATPTVTVSNAFGLTLAGKSWAIGGKRATLQNANSLKLLENNSAAGDAMAGWTIELATSQTHSFTAAVTMRRSGDQTDGPITIRTEAGYSARAILTWNNNGNAFATTTTTDRWHWEDLEMQNTNGTKTSAFAFSLGTGGPHRFLRIKCADATNKFGRFINATAGGNAATKLIGCEVGYTTLANTINWSNFFTGGLIFGCWFHDNTGSGTITLGTANGWSIINNLFTNNTGATITTASIAGGNVYTIIGNTSDGSGGDFLTATAGGAASPTILNNNIVNGGATGFDWGADTAARLNANNAFIDGNNTFNNTSGGYSPSGYGSDDPGVDPGFTNTGALNWGVSTALKALGIPLADYPGTTTHSYVDIGAAQRQEASSSTIAITASSPIVISAGGRVGY